MAKFKNIKKFTGVPSTTPPPTPVPQSQPQQKPVAPQKSRRVEPEVVKPIIPLASVTPEPKEEKKVEIPVRKSGFERTGTEVKTIVPERPVQVKDFSTKQKGAPILKRQSQVRPRRVGMFVMIMFFTVVLQVILLFSLLYLSPSLVR